MHVIIYPLQTISTEYEISDPIEFMVISYSPMAASAKKIGSIAHVIFRHFLFATGLASRSTYTG
jgi:hypothetical protein